MKKKVLFALIALFSFVGAWADNVVKIGETEYATFQGAWDYAKAVTDGSTTTITVLDGVTDIGGALGRLNGNKVILDLNGQDVTGSIYFVDGDVTIKNGTLSNETGTVSACGEFEAATLDHTTKLTIAEDATIVATGSNNGDANAVCLLSMGVPGQNTEKECSGVTIDILGTVKTETAANVSAKTSAAVFVSGNILKATENPNVVNISGTVSSNDDAAIALHGLATVNVEAGATVTGNTGICVKVGTLNVEEGATVAGTGAKVANPEAQSGKAEMTGAAVSLTDTYAANGPINVNITGGTFASANADALFQKAGNYNDETKISVTGGNFSDNNVNNFLTADYTTAKNTTATATTYDVIPLTDVDWTMTPTVVAYNAQPQAPTITVNATDYTVKYFKTGTTTEVDEMIDKGAYDVKVYVNDTEVGEAKTFTITAFQLTLGASVSYKQIGDPDPDPTYSLLYDNAPEAVKAEAANLKITGLKLTRSYPETNPIAEDKVGDQIACFIEMIDAKVVEIVDGEEVANENYQIGTSSVNTWLKVTQKLIDENFTIELAEDLFTYDKSEKTPAIVVKYKGTDVTDQFDLTKTVYANNVNANAFGQGYTVDAGLPTQKEVHDQIPGKALATATATPKADGKYAYLITTVEDNKTVTLYTDLDENTEGNQLLTAEFKIKQRQITAADLSDVSAKIFKNAKWEPEVTVSFENDDLDPTTVTLTKGTDYTLKFDDNEWVGTATYTVEATTGIVDAIERYNGNYYDKASKEFAINKYKFTLQPTPGKGKLYGTTAAENLTAEGVPAENMPELANIALNADGKLVDDNLAQIVAAGYTVTRSPADINEVGIYAVTINGAELKASTPAEVSDPAHNFDMTVVGGEFEIYNEDEYFVSSKFATREFESNNVTVPFNGFYVYRKTQTPVGYSNPPRTRELYVLIPEADAAELYEEIGQRVKANELAEEQDPSVIQLQVTDYRINPVINNDIVTSYTLSVLPASVTYLDGSNVNYVTRDVFTQEGEGTLRVTPRTIKIVAEDKNTTFGAENHPAELTWKVYGKAEDGTVTKELTGFSLIAGSAAEANQPNTVGNWEGLTSDALTFVPDETTVWSADNTITKSIVMAGTLQALNSANPNYSITFEEGTYTITKSDKTIDIAVTWTKAFGSDGEAIPTLTAKMGTDEYESANLPDPEDLSYTEQEGKPVGQSVGPVDVTVTGGPEFIDGYPVNYTGTYVTTSGDALTIIVNNQFPVYPAAPKSDFASPYVKITGPTTIAALAEEGLALQFNKPATGYIKNGGDLKVVCGETAFGTATGYTLAEADMTGAWAWAKNFASVTIKSGKARPSAADEITLDIVSFSPTNYNAEKDGADQLIRDYDGYDVKKVNLVCSGELFPITENKWYSLVLPFATSARQISKALNGYAVIDVLDNSEKSHATRGEDIRFTINVGEVAANTPFIFKVDEAWNFPQAVSATVNFAADKITIAYPGEDFEWPADQNGNQFIGTYKAAYGKDVKNVDNAFLDQDKNLIVNNAGKIAPAASDKAYLRPLGAYVQMANGYHAANARIFIEEADGTTTVIEGVDAEGAEVAYGEGWYTINGVKLEGEPATTGTYIFNGKKVFIQK